MHLTIIFNNRIEDFIMNLIRDLDIDLDIDLNKLTNDLLRLCQKYNDEIDEGKFKVQLYHLILSAGRCDKFLFVSLFKLIEKIPKEISEPIRLMSS